MLSIPSARCRALLSCAILSLLALGGCFVDPPAGFTKVASQGFDPNDNARDLNDYPWDMVFYQGDGASTGYLYCGTGNAVMLNILASVGFQLSDLPIYRPAELRRYRPDLGTTSWERVFDFRDVETGPDWQTTGYRVLHGYRNQSDGQQYLYAGTFGKKPALWRSRTGDPNSWEKFWENPVEGSVRSLAEHHGLLYIGVTHEYNVAKQIAGEIYVTDGAAVRPVMTDGFGTVDNDGIFTLASFNGWLYAGTINRDFGYEVWKLEGPDGQSTPVNVIKGGNGYKSQTAVSDLYEFKGYLYVPSIVFINFNSDGPPPIRRAADLARIGPDDKVERVAGPNSITGVEAGFGEISNSYLWCLAEHDGKLYCGTWDGSAFLPAFTRYLPDILRSVNTWEGRNVFAVTTPSWWTPQPAAWYETLNNAGGRMYVSDDGLSWQLVFDGGLGNPKNYGVRNITPVGDALYIGFSNIWDGLEIWKWTPSAE